MDFLQIKKYLPKGKELKETWEFFINDIPLSHIIENALGENPLTNGLKMVFESNNDSNKIIAQLFTLKVIKSDTMSYDERSYLGVDEEIKLLYGCPCGDYRCGGIGVKIKQTDGIFIWKLQDVDSVLSFSFDEWKYYDTFNKFLR